MAGHYCQDKIIPLFALAQIGQKKKSLEKVYLPKAVWGDGKRQLSHKYLFFLCHAFGRRQTVE